MDEETEKELTEHACELWAIRTVAIDLLADRLERSNDPKRAADTIIKNVYRSWEASSLAAAYPTLSIAAFSSPRFAVIEVWLCGCVFIRPAQP
jgi:hypothetical protein